MPKIKTFNPTGYDLALLTSIAGSTIYLSFSLSSAPIILLQIALLVKSLFFPKNQTTSAKEVISALLISPEPGLFLTSWLLLFKAIISKTTLKRLTIDPPVIAILALSITLFAYNLVSEKLFLNYPLWISTFLSGIFLYIYGKTLSEKINEIKIIKFIAYCILLQVIVISIQSIRENTLTPGDWSKGTLLDAHKLGLTFIFTSTFFLFKLASERRISDSLLLGIILAALYFCDAKAAILCGIVGILIYLLLISTSKRKTGKYFVFPHPLPMAAICAGVVAAIFVTTISEIKNSAYIAYIEDDFINSKYTFFNRVWLDIYNQHQINWIFGTGPGTLGSRASNILSADILYKLDESALSKLQNSSAWTKKYMQGLWTQELADNIKYYSAILSYPFSGITSIKAEIGLIGLALYTWLIFRIGKNLYATVNFRSPALTDHVKLSLSLSLCIYYLALFFDNFHEQPSIGYLLLFLCAIFSSERKIKYEYQENPGTNHYQYVSNTTY